MKYQPYQQYKGSGVEWLREIPKHWGVEKNKYAFQLSRSLVGERSADYQLLSLTLKGIIKRDIESGFGKLPAEFNTYQKVEEGDLVFCLFDIDETPRTIGLSKFRGMITGAYDVFKVTSKATPEFIYYYYLHLDSYKGLRPFYTGLRKVVRAETFSSIKIPLPPKTEQTQIAIFLDSETQKIDRLIEKQQQLIKLLQEKRQALISHAVTKGLNPDAKMKDSGVEWLGDIPEHWDVARLKFVAGIQTGIAKGKDNAGRDTIEVPYLRVANVQDGYLDLGTIATIEIAASDLGRYLLRAGDVLMNEGGDYDKLGRGHVWNGEIEPCIHQNHVFAIRPKSLESEWVNAISGSDYAQFYFVIYSKQTTNLASISSTNLMNIPVVLPPVGERTEILNFLIDKKSELDALEAKTECALELLKERRTALISAAVTGKIDVRNIVNG